MLLDRRSFMCRTAMGSTAGVSMGALASNNAANASDAADNPPLDLSNILNFCGHEHWGSILAIGTVDEGFRADVEQGAVPRQRAGILDLMFDPYGGGWMASAASDPAGVAKSAGKKDFFTWWNEAPSNAFAAVRPLLSRHRLTGVFRCTARGIQSLHGIDVASLDFEAWGEADKKIGAAYNRLHEWHKTAMDKMNIDGIIRPVHPEFYQRVDDKTAARTERGHMRTVLRIDPLLEMWPEKCPRRETLAGIVKADPADAKSWRDFIGQILDRASAGGAVGIKQLQAYHRSLDFSPREDRDVVFRGNLTDGQKRAFQDWIVNECCRQAHDRGWVHQIHVGTNNLSESSPLPLEALARRYGKMRLVMLHCWPFIAESGLLAKQLPNVYLDTCWQAILNPAFYQDCLRSWLGYVPVHKMMCSHDATSVEMAAGSLLFIRETLARELYAVGGGTEEAQALLHDNAKHIYAENA